MFKRFALFLIFLFLTVAGFAQTGKLHLSLYDYYTVRTDTVRCDFYLENSLEKSIIFYIDDYDFDIDSMTAGVYRGDVFLNNKSRLSRLRNYAK